MGTALYGWGDLVFETEAGMRDHSTLVLAPAGDPPRYSLTLSRDNLAGRTLDNYVDEALQELSHSLSGFRLLQRTRFADPHLHALILSSSSNTPEGELLAQHQAFVATAAGDGVLVVTGTCASSDDSARAAVERVLRSLRARAP